VHPWIPKTILLISRDIFMLFLIKRYWSALKAYKWFFPFVFIAPALYLASAALRQDLFFIYQDFTLPEQATVHFASYPEGIALSQLPMQSQHWFLDANTLDALMQLLTKEQRRLFQHRQQLEIYIRDTMALAIAGQDRLRLSYRGKQLAVGQQLIEFFSHQLLTQTNVSLQLIDTMMVNGERSPIWQNNSGHQSAWGLFAFSVLMYALIVGLAEIFDSSFKSERQMARYLGLPILGTLPDTRSLLQAFPKQKQLTPSTSDQETPPHSKLST
jgi:hypothetical protein